MQSSYKSWILGMQGWQNTWWLMTDDCLICIIYDTAWEEVLPIQDKGLDPGSMIDAREWRAAECECRWLFPAEKVLWRRNARTHSEWNKTRWYNAEMLSCSSKKFSIETANIGYRVSGIGGTRSELVSQITTTTCCSVVSAFRAHQWKRRRDFFGCQSELQ